MSMIEICGVLVHTRPEHRDGVSAELTAMPGVEIHEVSDQGRLVITIEQLPDGPRLSDSMAAIHNINNVLAASLVYEHSEPDPETESASQLEQAS